MALSVARVGYIKPLTTSDARKSDSSDGFDEITFDQTSISLATSLVDKKEVTNLNQVLDGTLTSGDAIANKIIQPLANEVVQGVNGVMVVTGGDESGKSGLVDGPKGVFMQ